MGVPSVPMAAWTILLLVDYFIIVTIIIIFFIFIIVIIIIVIKIIIIIWFPFLRTIRRLKENRQKWQTITIMESRPS